MLNQQVEPFEELFGKREKAKEAVKELMVALELTSSEGALYEADRKITPARVLDTTLLEAKLGDLDPYKRNASRNSITTKKKVK